MVELVSEIMHVLQAKHEIDMETKNKEYFYNTYLFCLRREDEQDPTKLRPIGIRTAMCRIIAMLHKASACTLLATSYLSTLLSESMEGWISSRRPNNL